MEDLFLLLDREIPIEDLFKGYIPRGYSQTTSYAGGLYFEKKNQELVIFDPVIGYYEDWAETVDKIDIDMENLWVVRIWMDKYKDLHDFLPGVSFECRAYVDNDHGLLMKLEAFVDYYRDRPSWDWRHLGIPGT